MSPRPCPRCSGELRFDEAGEVTGCSSGCALFLIRGSSSVDPPAEVERTLLTWPADLAETSELAWEALCGRCSDTEVRRFLCRFGSAVAWLQQREDGRLATVPLDRRRMVRLLARCGRWLRVTDSGAPRSRRRAR
jgi:hypothetical protein